MFSIQSPRRLYYFKVERDRKLTTEQNQITQAEHIKEQWMASLATETQACNIPAIVQAYCTN